MLGKQTILLLKVFRALVKGKALCSIEVSYNNCEIGCGICSSVMPAQIHTISASHKNIHIFLILKANRILSHDS